MTDYAEFTGTTQAIQSVDVRSRVQGWLQSMHYVPGAEVKKDDPLFGIEPTQYQAALDSAKGTLAQQQANLFKAQRDWDRAKSLGPSEALSQMEYDAFESAWQAAKANVVAAQAAVQQAQLNVDYTRVGAPIAGRVSRNQIDVGNLVGAGNLVASTGQTVLATVVDTTQVYVYFSASEADFLAMMRMFGPNVLEGQASQPADRRIAASLGLTDENGYPHDGRIDYVDIRLDPSTGTALIRAVFENSSGILVPGLFARVRVPLRTHKALLVPDVAVAADQAGQYVLLVDDRNVVERRDVHAGRTVDRMRVIEEGLGPADQVIVNGIQRARPGTAVRVVE